MSHFIDVNLCLVKYRRYYRPGKVQGLPDRDGDYLILLADGTERWFKRADFLRLNEDGIAWCRVNLDDNEGWELTLRDRPRPSADCALDLNRHPSPDVFARLPFSSQVFFITPILSAILRDEYGHIDWVVNAFYDQVNSNIRTHEYQPFGGFTIEDVGSIFNEIHQWVTGQSSWPNNIQGGQPASGRYRALSEDDKIEFMAQLLLPVTIGEILLRSKEVRTLFVEGGPEEERIYLDAKKLRTDFDWVQTVKREVILRRRLATLPLP